MTDPQHRIFLECAWEALEDAGIKAGDKARPIGVFAGTGMTSYDVRADRARRQILDAFPLIIATDKDFVSTRVSLKLEPDGPVDDRPMRLLDRHGGRAPRLPEPASPAVRRGDGGRGRGRGAAA